MTELDQPIVQPTVLQGQRRLQSALRAQIHLEELARLVLAMRSLQRQRGFGCCGLGSVQSLEAEVDQRVSDILNI